MGPPVEVGCTGAKAPIDRAGGERRGEGGGARKGGGRGRGREMLHQEEM